MNLKVLAALALLLFHLGCVEPDVFVESPDLQSKPEAAGTSDTEAAPSSPALAPIDDPETLDVGVWNLQWFGNVERGPSDDELQQANVRSILQALQFDLVGLVEVISDEAFAALVGGLPGYEGVLATDPLVSLGSEFYWSGEQKVGLVFRERFQVESARLVLTEHSWEFAGRPPLEVKLRFSEDGNPRTLVVLVAHFKAMPSADGYYRRVAAAAALEEFLSEEYPYQWVVVLGDFNDDLDTSTYSGLESPFASLADSPDYRFATDSLTEDGISTTTHYETAIDHHLITNDLAERFVEGSARVLRVDEVVENYAETTSDHYPVLTRYDLR